MKERLQLTAKTSAQQGKEKATKTDTLNHTHIHTHLNTGRVLNRGAIWLNIAGLC